MATEQGYRWATEHEYAGTLEQHEVLTADKLERAALRWHSASADFAADILSAAEVVVRSTSHMLDHGVVYLLKGGDVYGAGKEDHLLVVCLKERELEVRLIVAEMRLAALRQ